MTDNFTARITGVNVYAVPTWDDPELRAVVKVTVGDPSGPQCDFDSVVYDATQFARLLLSAGSSDDANVASLVGRTVLCCALPDGRVRLLGFFNPITED